MALPCTHQLISHPGPTSASRNAGTQYLGVASESSHVFSGDGRILHSTRSLIGRQMQPNTNSTMNGRQNATQKACSMSFPAMSIQYTE